MTLELIKGLALTGGDWVIWMLLASSVLALAVIIERGILLKREKVALEQLRERIGDKIASADLGVLGKEAAKVQGLAARVLSAGIVQASHGAAVAEEYMAAAGLEERQAIERRVMILGTLGNNAPFIGLFGTVLGVIKAFRDLAMASTEGPEAVMRGLSEALIATAVGLFVAIPCVIAFNFFQKRIKDLLSGVETMNRLLLARLKTK
ncbi:MAG: MotA/TolQ/ExbB proton channel family protein [Elusimicrobia bacterium]|nr:MotA/TolQ/ExbB proton channel family protein [Elusimicrobiota bacterium]